MRLAASSPKAALHLTGASDGSEVSPGALRSTPLKFGALLVEVGARPVLEERRGSAFWFEKSSHAGARQRLDIFHELL